jgi:hypothetical protein
MGDRASITGLVHTRDSAKTLERALVSLRWVDELIVVDMESRDDTLAIARRLADRVVGVPVAPRVDGVRNAQLELAAHEWIFVLDSDEYLAADASVLARGLVRAHGDRFDAFAIPRFNYIAGQLMRGSGWYPDHQVRLFRKGTVRWADRHHQPPTVLTGKSRQLTLTPPACLHLHHLNYTDLREFIRKQVEYALADQVPADPAAFDFRAYLAAARAQLAARADRDRDGDLSSALALLMAWHEVVRGLAHWDTLTPRPPLPPVVVLPDAPARLSWSARVRRGLAEHPQGARALRALARPLRAIAERLAPPGRRA